MQTTAPWSSTVFNRSAFRPSNKIMIVNKSRILEIVLKLKEEKTLSSLRNETLHLKNQLINTKSDEIGLINIDSDSDTIKIAQRYLFDEIRQIAEAQTLERAKYYVERFEKSITEIKTSKVNDINLNRWKEYTDIYTDSLWMCDKRDNSGVHAAGYWGNFIPQIPNQMIKRYTKKGDWILDAFVGCGTSLIESQRLGRHGIGIELQESIAQKAQKFISSEPNEYGVISKVVTGDSSVVDYKSLLQKYGQKSVQLLIMHPPYFDIIKFSDDPRDLSNASSVDSFLKMMNKIVDNTSSVLDRGRYFALVIGDKYSKGEWIPLGFLTMNEIMKRGFSLKSVIVKNFEETTGKRNQKELWRYRALVGGFYIFKHEYIFLFKKK
ncbi:MAG: DNA methyltransferase [Epsilonproteobacteria bacterium]|nr:DNA methyltransferase [Campylobacterota bacterium]